MANRPHPPVASEATDLLEVTEQLDDQPSTRLCTEIDLLNAMYPGKIMYNDAKRKLTYNSSVDLPSTNQTSGDQGVLTLLIPVKYPTIGLPEVVTAFNSQSKNITTAFSQVLQGQAIPEGIEMLDEVIDLFNKFLESNQCQDDDQGVPAEETQPTSGLPKTAASSNAKKTIIIWLHHLLNTSKRKQVLSPPSSAVTGISKPGYPGVMIFSGPEADVCEHVAELKALNWQAFQVRYEDDEEWSLQHGSGMTEVGSMSELVNDVGDSRKSTVMNALKMK